MAQSTVGSTAGPVRGATRNQGLDLLRAMAILGVLVMHFALRLAGSRGQAPPALTELAGFLGVELFFVLSGFLIGRILIRIADGGPGLRDWRIFMTRRWMRTVPLYLLWLAVLLVAAPPVHDRLHMALAYASFTQNLAWPVPQGWFSVSWSLTTEEWFYLLFSATVLGLARLVGRHAVPIACAAFVVLPLAARYFLLPAGMPFDAGMRQIALYRLDAIAYGVLVAWVLSEWPQIRVGRKLPQLFLLGYTLVFVAIDMDRALFAVLAPLLLSLTSIMFALWLPAALEVRIASPLLAAAVRWLSERSYCLYLIHLSVIAFVWQVAGPVHLPVILRVAAALLLCGGLAELSFRYIESPILRRRPRQPMGSRAVVEGDALPVQQPGYRTAL